MSIQVERVVRVTRERKLLVTDYVDVTVTFDNECLYLTPETLAQKLVEAQVAAGQNIDWKGRTEAQANTYDKPDYSTEREPVVPAPKPEPLALHETPITIADEEARDQPQGF